MRARLVGLLAGMLVLGGVNAQAQVPVPTGRRADRVRVSLNAGSQATTTTFTQTRAFEEFLEQGSLTLTRDIPAGPFYEGGIAVRVWRGLTFGVAASYFEDTGGGAVSAQIPHPFYFDRPRAVSGDASRIDRREIAGHAQCAWLVRAGRRFELTLSGGPSVFAVEQVFVSGVAYTQQYPFDAAAFDHVTTELVKDTVVGYHGAIDLTWRFASHVGAGGLVRFSRGTKALRPSGGDPVSIRTGGLQAGGGLRLIF
jgi:hypothetical protein